MWKLFLIVIVIGISIPDDSFAQAEPTKRQIVGSYLFVSPKLQLGYKFGRP